MAKKNNDDWLKLLLFVGGGALLLYYVQAGQGEENKPRKRFIQEAKAASALNHPNILTVYEIGRSDDATFIAIEFVNASRCGNVCAWG